MGKLFDIIMYANAEAIDTTTVHNEVRIPLIQGLAKALPNGGKLLVVTHYLSLLAAPVRQPRRILNYMTQSHLRQDADNLWVYTPSIPINLAVAFKMPGVLSLCRLYFGTLMRRILRSLGFSSLTPRVVWTSSPFHFYYRNLVEEKLTVYDCYDDYSIIGGGPPDRDTLELERYYASQVDIILTAARRQYERLEPRNANIHYFPNAVDFYFFNQATKKSIAIARALKDIPKPIVGLMGGISNWYNFEMLQEVVSSRRDWSFVFIGQLFPNAKDYMTTLQNFPNFHFLGWQKFEDLPRFLKGFDVAIMPYRLSDLGHSVHPDKMYQYMAAGLPIVATPIREVVQFSNVIELAQGGGNFCAAIERSLYQRNYAKIHKGIAIAQRESWNARAETAVNLIMNNLKGGYE